MKKILALALLVMLVGCSQSPEERGERLVADQCVRAELFQACMSSLPKGPERVTAAGNDWDEVVDSCGSQAYYTSLRPAKVVPVRCGGELNEPAKTN